MQTKEQMKNWKVVASVATVAALGVSGLAIASPGDPEDNPPPIEIEDRRQDDGQTRVTTTSRGFEVVPGPSFTPGGDDSLDSPLASADVGDSPDAADSPDNSVSIDSVDLPGTTSTSAPDDNDSPENTESPDVADSPDSADSPESSDSPDDTDSVDSPDDADSVDSPDDADSVDSLDS